MDIRKVTHLKSHKISPALTFLMVLAHPKGKQREKKTLQKSSVIFCDIYYEADLRVGKKFRRRRAPGDYCRPTTEFMVKLLCEGDGASFYYDQTSGP